MHGHARTVLTRSTGDSRAGGDSNSGDRQYCDAAIIPDLVHRAIDRGGGPHACIAEEGLHGNWLGSVIASAIAADAATKAE